MSRRTKLCRVSTFDFSIQSIKTKLPSKKQRPLFTKKLLILFSRESFQVVLITNILSFLIADTEGIGDSLGKFLVFAKRHSGNKGHCELFGYCQLPTLCPNHRNTNTRLGAPN